MNEIIEQLYAEAKQATKIGKMNAPAGVVAEKFAELIVRECVLEAMDAIHHDTSIRIQLYKHFGVPQ